MENENNKRVSTTFAIDADLLEEFKRICQEKSINRSRLIEKYIEEYVKIINEEEKNK